MNCTLYRYVPRSLGPKLGPTFALSPTDQINVTNHAGIVHLTGTVAVCYFLPQIRQPHIGSVSLNQFLFAILAGGSAFRTRQANNLAGIFAEQ